MLLKYPEVNQYPGNTLLITDKRVIRNIDIEELLW